MNKAIIHFVELLYLLVQKELKVRYKSSILGYLWALANPFAFALVYYFAFKIIMRVQMPNYSVFLLTGMFPWVWFTNSLTHATGSYRNNVALVKKVNMRRAILPLSNVAHEMVHFCLALPVLAFFIWFTGSHFYLSWIWQLPMMILLQLMLLYPIALMLAIFNVYVHDVEYLVGIALSLLFFLTPIVYPVSLAPPAYRGYFDWNPLAIMTENWRHVLLEGNLNGLHLAYCVLLGVCLAALSAKVYRHTSAKLGELL